MGLTEEQWGGAEDKPPHTERETQTHSTRMDESDKECVCVWGGGSVSTHMCIYMSLKFGSQGSCLQDLNEEI